MDSVDARFEPCVQCSGDMITDGTGKTSPDDCIIRKYRNGYYFHLAVVLCPLI